ncbi:SoxR (2Fe-2S) reducing system protein RsxE [Gammaproteobacteria bacterium]
MITPSYSHIIHEGLWHNNPNLVQILGMCPLLATTTNAVNGLGMGLATTLVLFGSNIVISLIRDYVVPDVRIPIFVLVIASLVTIVDLAMNAYVNELYKVLGIYIPLIVVNCIIIGRAEAFASKYGIGAAAMDGLAMGLGTTAVLTILGAMRELVGNGTLFSQIHMMFGETARGLTLVLPESFHPALVGILPPGAFIGLALLIALKRAFDIRTGQRISMKKP